MSKRVRIAAIAAAAALLVAAGAIGALAISGGGSDHQTAAVATSSKGYLGLTVTANPTQGLRVASVENNGPAAKADPSWVAAQESMAARQGFEPRLTGPEPVVLPLHYRAALRGAGL